MTVRVSLKPPISLKRSSEVQGLKAEELEKCSHWMQKPAHNKFLKLKSKSND